MDSLSVFFKRLAAQHLNQRKPVTNKISSAINSHSDGFNTIWRCNIKGYFLIRVYPRVPLIDNIEIEGEAISIVKLNKNEKVSIVLYNECWVELVEVSQAQYETYLEFGSLKELGNEKLTHQLTEKDKLEIQKVSTDDSSVSYTQPV